MKVGGSFSLFLSIALAVETEQTTWPGSVRCSGQDLALPNSVIVSVDHHTKGDVIPLPNTVLSCGGSTYTANITTDLCRIVVNVSTSASSSVRLEAWLPENWNGRFLATGGGGIGGCIDYATVQSGAGLGFAALGTNGGHDGSDGYEFFLDQPEVINDWGHRSIHVEAVVGKQITSQHYGRNATKNYYLGCSTGGRQGLQEAYLYPEDFDGIVVGAPGVEWMRIAASFGILARRVGWPFDPNSAAYVRPEQWLAIVAKQIELLDPLDGVTDGIIDDPTRYSIDPTILSCGAGILNNSVCLTPSQVGTVRAAYLPIANSTGQIVYPAFGLGADTSIFTDNISSIVTDFWRGTVYNDSSWSPTTFNETDMDIGLKYNPGGIETTPPFLSSFYQRGGKILAYQGRSDELVPSTLAIEYFAGVRESANLTLNETLSFYRLFLIPGMHHCSGGPGAWNVGQTQGNHILDPTRNVLLAMANWVENGTAPEELTGTKYANDDIEQPITAQRKYCPYPYVSKWDGQGPTNVSTSWTCVAPGNSY